jgi:hypothetical protein
VFEPRLPPVNKSLMINSSIDEPIIKIRIPERFRIVSSNIVSKKL